jgi:hypothetical protein
MPQATKRLSTLCLLRVGAVRDYDNIEERTCVFELGGVEI